jgi:thiol-disulfide isomerase/thioredoxin
VRDGRAGGERHAGRILDSCRQGSSSSACSPKSGQAAQAADAAVVSMVRSVPQSVLDTVGTGTVRTLPKAISGAALTEGGKPSVLYVGAEYCPYCATERWAVAVALSRFGSFTNLGETSSSPSDVYPNTATLTFHGAGYSSKYLAFTGKETQSNQVVNGGYATLDTLTAAEQALVDKYDPSQGIPFIDIGGKYVISGASYDPAVLQGKTQAQIAAALSAPSSAIAKGVDGTANVITAALCAATGGKPANVCTAPGVVQATARLNAAG